MPKLPRAPRVPRVPAATPKSNPVLLRKLPRDQALNRLVLLIGPSRSIVAAFSQASAGLPGSLAGLLQGPQRGCRDDFCVLG